MRAEAQCLSWLITPSDDDQDMVMKRSDTTQPQPQPQQPSQPPQSQSSPESPQQVEVSSTGQLVGKVASTVPRIHVFIASMTDQREYFHRYPPPLPLSPPPSAPQSYHRSTPSPLHPLTPSSLFLYPLIHTMIKISTLT